ncbi:MAG: putative DNA-binding domain-containing protein [Pseudomonadales bacterium]|nr:putative DNA-binding domain-containing protein [Pseudomonadales bacterium]MBO6597559.1 putative DNA-binding domain-containing protein [Pseudomonadales bacterium]MBO6824391.1 putative DNA-binding domain-containing protein [Pseudomonadales bacterium]
MGELKKLQKAFTEHLRNPDHVPVPAGLDERRMSVYSELIFNNVSSLLSDFFPVIKSIVSDDAWQSIVRNFFVSHESQTPYFMALSGEFVEYLAQAQLSADLPDYLTELAHYEWVELALFTMDEAQPDELAGDIGHLQLSLSPLAQPLVYNYPVHQISPDFQPTAPGDTPTYLLVCRIPDESVRFFELQPLAFHLLNDMHQTSGLVPADWLQEKADEFEVQEKDEFVRNGLALIQSFNQYRVFTDN